MVLLPCPCLPLHPRIQTPTCEPTSQPALKPAPPPSACGVMLDSGLTLAAISSPAHPAHMGMATTLASPRAARPFSPPIKHLPSGAGFVLTRWHRIISTIILQDQALLCTIVIHLPIPETGKRNLKGVAKPGDSHYPQRRCKLAFM